MFYHQLMFVTHPNPTCVHIYVLFCVCEFYLVLTWAILLMQLGALAVAIRQTNIIWILFVACSGIIDLTLAHRRDKINVGDINVSIKEKGQQAPINKVDLRSSLRKRKSSSSEDDGLQPMSTTSTTSKDCMSGLIPLIERIISL